MEGVNLSEFFGTNNIKFEALRRHFPKLKLIPRGGIIKISGNDADILEFQTVTDHIIEFLTQYGSIEIHHIDEIFEGKEPTNVPQRRNDVILFGPFGNQIRAKTPGQKRLVAASEDNDIVFAIGPAGTGKTYTAVSMAVKALKNKVVKRIILTRPAVEAGENLGFLPGDLKDKVDPYLRPLYDALDDMLPVSKMKYFMENRIIEVAPIAYMRGRTLDNAFLILDEAQNTTSLQLKMFLTRLGPSAKCIITGDLTQIDLPRNQKSGLQKALDILKGIEGIGQVFLNEEDVIRHKLVKKIIKAYQTSEDSDKAFEEEKRKANNN